MSTVQLSDQLYREVEQFAARSQRSVQAVVEDALRTVLPRARQENANVPVELPTFGGSGLQPGVDLENRSALLDLLDDRG